LVFLDLAAILFLSMSILLSPGFSVVVSQHGLSTWISRRFVPRGQVSVDGRYPTLKGHQPVSVTFPSIGPHAPAWGEHHARVRAAERLESAPELALVCAKAQDAEAAIRADARHLAGIPVVIVQNGLNGLEAAGSLLPVSRCVGAIAIFAADRPAPGQVKVAAAGPLYLGDGDEAWAGKTSSAFPPPGLHQGPGIGASEGHPAAK